MYKLANLAETRTKILSLIFLLWLFSFSVFAQQKPVISQYMFNGLVLNPAYTGANGHFSATALYRDQWVNLNGAPTISTFTAHGPIKNKRISLGMMVTNDKVGVHSDLGVYATYAYHIPLNNGKISLGLQAGFNNLQSNFSELNIRDIDDPFLTGSLSSLKMNFGTGVYYHSQRSYIGVSIPYIRRKRVIKDATYIREMDESRNYYVNAGTVIDINHRVKVKPSALLRLENGMPVAGDLNVNVYLDDVLNLGASYRSGDSFISLFEIKLNDFLRLGYAYDWVISDLAAYTKGSHEFMLNYRIDFFAPRKHKMCPGPFYF